MKCPFVKRRDVFIGGDGNPNGGFVDRLEYCIKYECMAYLDGKCLRLLRIYDTNKKSYWGDKPTGELWEPRQSIGSQPKFDL